MLVIKVFALWLTRSTAILGDAAESVVHVAAVAFVAYSLHLSQKPADRDHTYGHAKISFFSAGMEGMLITIAGAFIFFESIRSWVAGNVPDQIGWGILLVALALIINSSLGWYLLRTGKKHHSLIVEANGRHVLVDAWTSVGVLLGLVLAWATGWWWLDPLFAIGIAVHILRGGMQLLWRSANGLMDRADPEVRKAIMAKLDEETTREGISWHQMRHRHLGDGHWVDVHLVFADKTPVRDAHAVATRVEDSIREVLGPNTTVTTHLEPEDDHERIHGHPPGADPYDETQSADREIH